MPIQRKRCTKCGEIYWSDNRHICAREQSCVDCTPGAGQNVPASKNVESKRIENNSQPKTARCPACGTENRSGQTECVNCGAKIDIILCSACGTMNSTERDECHACGGSLVERPLNIMTNNKAQGNSIWLWFLIICAVIGFYFFFFKPVQKEAKLRHIDQEILLELDRAREDLERGSSSDYRLKKIEELKRKRIDIEFE